MSGEQVSMSEQRDLLPVAIIGAGPVGLAAAAHLIERGITPVIFEAGARVGAAIRNWEHIRLFSPWRHNIDAASRRLLETTGWTGPRLTALPYGAELVEHYLEPLEAVPSLAAALHTSSAVTAISRVGMDKTHSRGRDSSPFLVRVKATGGSFTDHRVRAVIDTSGTWAQSNPLGQSGLSAAGETEAIGRGLITEPLPDVTGTDRSRFEGKHVLVVGSGHSAVNTLIALGQLTKNGSGTRISWVIRSADPERLYGGGNLDGLPARGQLGARLRQLVEDGNITLHTSLRIESFASGDNLMVNGETPGGPVKLDVDLLIPATGFRPDLDILRELRLDMDSAVEAPRKLGPLIDPEFHSCGTVPPHGAKILAHPEQDFYIAGMKSYGRAPTFLLATGYEQVRSIAAALAGDSKAANTVQLELPETGVCSTASSIGMASPSCSLPEPIGIGIPTGVAQS
jgi:thioredoxin reductase